MSAEQVWTLIKWAMVAGAVLLIVGWFLLERKRQRAYYAMDEKIMGAIATEKRRMAAGQLRKRFTPIGPGRSTPPE